MNKIKWFIGMAAAILVAYFVVTERTNNTTEQVNNDTIITSGLEVRKRFDEKGNLKSDMEMIDGVRNGNAHNYYNDGNIHSIIHYKNDKKNGVSTWYYQNGKPYRETLFEDDKKHGVQKKYYKSGALMAEIPYANNKLQPGTKEYTETGNLIEEKWNFKYSAQKNAYPNIEITGKDLKKVTSFKAFFYSNSAEVELKPERDDRALRFYLPSNFSKANSLEVTIWLSLKTKMNNKIIVEKKILLKE